MYLIETFDDTSSTETQLAHNTNNSDIKIKLMSFDHLLRIPELRQTWQALQFMLKVKYHTLGDVTWKFSIQNVLDIRLPSKRLIRTLYLPPNSDSTIQNNKENYVYMYHYARNVFI